MTIAELGESSVLGGSVIGKALRRHWLPVLPLDALARHHARRARLLGEDLVLFVDATGALGLIGDSCPHRGVSLEWGIAVEEGLRCPYHGWCFDRTGQCVDIPLETAGLSEQVKLVGYPVRELGGVVFAYLGEGAPPELPRFPELTDGAFVREMSCGIVAANWIDLFEQMEDAPLPLETLERVAPGDHRSASDWEEEPGGLHYLQSYRDPAGALAPLELPCRLVAPFYSIIGDALPRTLRMRVPLDDTHTMVLNCVLLAEAPRDLPATSGGAGFLEGSALDAVGFPLLELSGCEPWIPRGAPRASERFRVAWTAAVASSLPESLSSSDAARRTSAEGPPRAEWQRSLLANHLGPERDWACLLVELERTRKDNATALPPGSSPALPDAARAALKGVLGDAGARGSSWRCADFLVRVQAPAWLEELDLGSPASELAGLPSIIDAFSAQAVSQALDRALAAVRLAARERYAQSLKQAWSKAWPAAWNRESSSKWAAARDAALRSAWNASWRTACEAMSSSGALALAQVACAGGAPEPAGVATAALALCTNAARGANWSAAWSPTWEASSTEVNRPVLVQERLLSLATEGARLASTASQGRVLQTGLAQLGLAGRGVLAEGSAP